MKKVGIIGVGEYLPQKKYHQKPSGEVFKDAVILCCIGTSTAVIERSVFDDIGRFDETLPACEDYDLWLRISEQLMLLHIPESLLTIRVGPHSSSATVPTETWKQCYARVFEKAKARASV